MCISHVVKCLYFCYRITNPKVTHQGTVPVITHWMKHTKKTLPIDLQVLMKIVSKQKTGNMRKFLRKDAEREKLSTVHWIQLRKK